MFKKSELQVLNHLTLDPDGQGFISQIARDIGISKSEVSKAVKGLKAGGLVSTESKGKNVICTIDRNAAFSANLRTAFNLLEIMPVLTGLRTCSEKIVLFGSCAEGSDTAESDIDLFVVARDAALAGKAAQKIRLSRPVQWVIRTPQEYVVLNHKDPAFADAVGQGIVLWEAV